MTSKRILATALGASLLLGATACGDDDDDVAATTTTTQADGPTAIEVTLTADGFDGMPSELPAGLVEITLVNDSGAFGSLDITRVTPGTTEDEFVDGLAPLLEGGPFPDFFEGNAGIEAEPDETQTSTLVLREGEHIVWYEVRQPEGDDEEEPEVETETATETVTETATEPDTSTTVAGDDDSTSSTTEETTSTTSTTATTVAGDEEQGAPAAGQPTGTLTAVSAEDESETDTESDSGMDDAAEEDEPLAEEPEGGDEGEGGEGAPEIITAALEVTAGDDAAELPEGDGEIVAQDYGFEATLDGPGTINFRNEGPQQFHHAVVMDFGTNDPADVEEVFPAILAAEGGGTGEPDTGDLDMEQVDFDFGGSGVFGPDGAGTFQADIVEGNTYVLACFIQDRTGGPPHAVAYDMWEVVQAGGGSTTTTAEG